MGWPMGWSWLHLSEFFWLLKDTWSYLHLSTSWIAVNMSNSSSVDSWNETWSRVSDSAFFESAAQKKLLQHDLELSALEPPSQVEQGTFMSRCSWYSNHCESANSKTLLSKQSQMHLGLNVRRNLWPTLCSIAANYNRPIGHKLPGWCRNRFTGTLSRVEND